MSYEANYKKLVKKILDTGELRAGRNGNTKAIFGETLTIDLNSGFPLLTGRRIHYKGVFGELAAMLRGPKTLKDFKDYGCNYWDLWARPDGSIDIDYGNAWLDFNGVNQLDALVTGLIENPHGRRHVVTGWRPDRLDMVSLPCCHYAYQWYVRDNKYLDMLWHQRSVDTMIGLPSDVVFASAWNIILANEVRLIPGKITFTLGDTHIYEEHLNQAKEYLEILTLELPTYKLTAPKMACHTMFTPSWIEIENYSYLTEMKFELKA